MKLTLRCVALCAAVLAATGAWADRPANLVETPMYRDAVASGKLPPVTERLPQSPLVVTFDGTKLKAGQLGGRIDMIMSRSKDVRQLVVYGYARLVGYDTAFRLVPDVLEKFEVEDGRIFTLHLRRGHRWSDGQPFTAEDFRYYWEDMVTNKDFTAGGPPREMIVDGETATFEVIDPQTVRYTWSKPNPFFLPGLAGARPTFIYRPSEYLKQFHVKYADKEQLDKKIKAFGQRNWVALHFFFDKPYKNENPAMPSLQPWVNTTSTPADRFVFERNPFYHRVDEEGRQLPYLDGINVMIANSKLIPAKAGAGEAHLQSRGLAFNNYTFLKRGEKRGKFKVHLWRTAKGSQMALLPNLNAEDPAWRKLNRDPNYRRALSLAIDRDEINQVIYFGLGLPGNNSVLPDSPLYKDAYSRKWAKFDLKRANKLLDGLGLTKRNDDKIRLLADGRPMEIVVEVADVPSEATDILQLIRDSWRKVGIKLFTKPLQREVFRNRVFAGSTVMSVWYGLENGIPAATSSPAELAPTNQQHLQWPKWGQHYQTLGRAGDAVDMPAAKRLAELEKSWRVAQTDKEREQIWSEMLSIHADNVFTIGTVAGIMQPVVVSNRLRNVPEKAVYNWDPGAHLGIYRPDQFWLAAGR